MNTMLPQLQHWTAKPNMFVYLFHVALKYPYKLINVILVFFFALAMFFPDFVGFFFLLYSVCYVVVFFLCSIQDVYTVCERLF